VHTAWSGNHTHYAERLFTGTQVIGGGDRALGWRLPADGGDGLVLPGAVLGSAGVMATNMHPDHAILYRAEALD
jgi:alpha-galactosidase